MSGGLSGDKAGDRLFRIGVPVGLVLVAMLMFGISIADQPVPFGMLVSAAIWALTVFLFGGLPALVFRRQWPYLIAGGLAAVVISSQWAGGSVWLWLATWVSLFGASIATGYLARTGRPLSVVFGIGALIVIVANLLWVVPVYREMAAMIGSRFDELIETFRSQLVTAGNSAETVEEYVKAMNALRDGLIRLLPGGMALAAATQYALGFFWFSHAVVAPAGQRAVVPSFLTWRAPFALTGLLLLACAGRFLGNDTVKIVADNVLLVLAIVYAVCGTTLVESFMRRVHIGWFGRIVVYFMLFLAQLIGFIMVALIGFGDSYFDWRGRAERAVDAGN